MSFPRFLSDSSQEVLSSNTVDEAESSLATSEPSSSSKQEEHLGEQPSPPSNEPVVVICQPGDDSAHDHEDDEPSSHSVEVHGEEVPPECAEKDVQTSLTSELNVRQDDDAAGVSESTEAFERLEAKVGCGNESSNQFNLGAELERLHHAYRDKEADVKHLNSTIEKLLGKRTIDYR